MSDLQGAWISREGGWNRRRFLAACGVVAAGGGMGEAAWGAEAAAKKPELAFDRTPEAVRLTFGPREVLKYQLKKPAKGGPSVESACYLHPLTTPAGTVVTEVAPEDHPHHRGVFLGWVEMHGKKDADFWGWGEPAPVARRRIENRQVDAPPPVLGFPKFRVVNEWMADGVRMVTEDLRASVSFQEGGTIVDIAVQLRVEAEVTLSRWAFGGFAVRTRKEGVVGAVGPEGVVRRAVPKHTDPKSNWPDAHWYALHQKPSGGKEATVAVASRASNPATTWHVVPSIGLLNPCLTAAGPVKVVPGQPLTLRYRVMAFDGPPKVDVLHRLGEDWYHGRQSG